MIVPQISVVLSTDRFDTVRDVVARLQEQTLHDRIELVLVAPDRAALALDDGALAAFAAHVVVEAPLQPSGAARAAGVRAATAPLVFLGETHSFGHPSFVERLVRSHGGGVAAVVPGIGNANPTTALSWSALLLDYGPWLHTRRLRNLDAAPMLNIAYDRELLVALDDLEAALASRDTLGAAFRARKYRYRFEPDARLDHANVAQWRPWIDAQYLAGRVDAAARGRQSGLGQRLRGVVAAPLRPLALLRSTESSVDAARSAGLLPRGTRTTLAVGAVLRAMGEMVGYTLGASAAHAARLEEYELHRLRYAGPIQLAETTHEHQVVARRRTPVRAARSSQA